MDRLAATGRRFGPFPRAGGLPSGSVAGVDRHETMPARGAPVGEASRTFSAVAEGVAVSG